MKKTSTLILNNDDVEKKLARIAFQIIEEYHSEKELLILILVKMKYLKKLQQFLRVMMMKLVHL